MKHKNRFSLKSLSSLFLLALLLVACNSSGSMSDDEKEIAVAVALTQTAAAVAVAPAAVGSTPDAATVVASAAVTETATPAAVEATVAPTVAPVEAASTVAAVITPTVASEVAAAAETTEAPAPDLAIDQLPVTQNSLKVRTLLVAPGEPGALYALLTDAADNSTPATNARFLMSTDFGANWTAAQSGLPVADDCLFNINMDYYASTALYASTCQGIYRWSKSSDEWTLIAEEQTGMLAIVYGNDNLIWATRPYGVEGAPVLLSQNGGQSWLEIEMAHSNGVASIGISPRDSQSGYAIVWPDGNGSYLRRGSIVQEWRVMPGPASGTPINPGMTIDGGTGWLYVTTTEAEGDRLWRSSDPDTPLIDDVGWEEVHHFAPGMTVNLLASGWSAEQDQLAIYANVETTVDGQPRFTLIRSLDNGVTWQPLVVDAG